MPALVWPTLLAEIRDLFPHHLTSTVFLQPDTVLSYERMQTDMEVSVIMADRPITTTASRLMALPGGE